MAAPRKDNVKKLITKSLEKLLEEKLFAEISTSEIAAYAGISKGTLYYHYKSKDSILFAIMDEYLEDQWDAFIAWTSNEEKDTSLPRLIKYVLQRDTNKIDIRMHFIYEAISGNEILKESLQERYKKFAVLIAEKISERDILNPEYVAWLLLIISDGLLIQKNLGNTELNTEEFIEETEKVARLLTK